LAVEEQFYLVFPLLVWFTGLNKGASKSGIHFLIVAGILSVLSLISFVVLYSTNQAAAYFLMPTRFWEMAAGGLVLVVLKQREDLACLLKKVPSALVLAAISVLMLLPLAAAVPATIATVALSALMMASLEQGKGLEGVRKSSQSQTSRLVWFDFLFPLSLALGCAIHQPLDHWHSLVVSAVSAGLDCSACGNFLSLC
jgi:peptidoglycan/LPS O-acetylase OafA/YrhL